MDRDALVDSIKTSLDAWNAEIDRMQARAREAEAEARERYDTQLREMKMQRDRAEEELAKAMKASETAWKDMGEGMTDAWTAIAEGFRKASGRFG